MKKRAWLGWLAAAFLVGCASTHDTNVTDDSLNESKALGMTDVTILYPLPTAEYFDDLLGPSSEGSQGELLPAALFAPLAKIPAPKMIGFDGTPQDPQKLLFATWADSFSLLRVVGIRLDPCFGQTTNLDAPDCTNTIRLTAQFFNPIGNGSSVFTDGKAAIHLFYKLTRADFTDLANGMLALRQTAGLPLEKTAMVPVSTHSPQVSAELGVNPTLASEGVRGPYAQGLKDLILKYAGERTLTRIAFCVQDREPAPGTGYYTDPGDSPNTRWVFGGFEYAGGALQPLSISSLDYAGLQTLDSVPFNGKRDAVIVTPAIAVADNILPAFNRNTLDGKPVDPATIEQARQASLKLEDPASYTARSADCVSCHMAKLASPDHGADPLDYKSYTFRLDHSSDRVGPFRMFGYQNDNVVVSGRVVNETAVVLDYLNKIVLH